MATDGETCYPVAVGEKENGWGKVASNVPDPPKCIASCRTRFLKSVLQDFDESRFSEVCGVLSKDEGANKRLWELYCCNSTACGVTLATGQDPGVNLIIGTCQNIGVQSVQDPGSPPFGYSCPAIATPENCQKPFLVSDTRPRPTLSTTTTSFPMTTTSLLMTSTTPLTAVGSSTYSTDSAVGTLGASSPTQSHEQPRSGGLSLGIRIAIGVSCTLALVAILAVATCMYRRRSRRGYTQSIRSEIKHQPLPKASSPTSLISPASSTYESNRSPVTPPLRLKERRLLPTLFDSTLSPAVPDIINPFPGPLSISSPGGLSQSSPSSSWNSNSNPSHGRAPRSHIYPSSSGFTGKTFKTASMRSAASSYTTKNTSHVSSAFPYPPPSSPSRPPRPHNTPLRIPDLVCPGPPPTRALPPAPPVTPIILNSPLRYQSTDTGHNMGLVMAGFVPPRNPARGVVLGKESWDLCELTESYAREVRDRDSWGSWSIGGGGTGVGANSIQRGGDGRVNSPVLEEADLERMGGSY
nr:uncharacterized protein CTRU02_04208 [Colletotrichum truncatum]KAF6796247.1 hypothetical protein CTRU02_04208 [Colletotrichum truncatum]